MTSQPTNAVDLEVHGTPPSAARQPLLPESIIPLDGESGIPSVTQPSQSTLSKKGLLAVSLLAVSLIAASVMSIQRAIASNRHDADAKRLADRPTAAATEPRRLDLSLPQSVRMAAISPAPIPFVPAIGPAMPRDLVDLPTAIAVRPAGPAHAAPEDAPVLLVSARPGSAVPIDGAANVGLPSDAIADDTDNDPLNHLERDLDGYQRQLQTLLQSLASQADLIAAAADRTNEPLPPIAAGLHSDAASAQSGLSATGSAAHPDLFGGQLPRSATPRVRAALLGDRNLTLPKGTAFTCALKTRIVSAAAGLVSCQVQRHVYGDNGRVLLIERGSHLDGEYRITSVRPGTVRIPVLWTRVRTPNGVVVELDSPGTGPLGESGVDGYVDNRWSERVGAAMLLSLIDDSVKLVIQNQASDSAANTVVLPSTTANGSKLAEKVLDSTVNIPPLIYQNQGAIVGIYVARDVDFSAVYGLAAAARKDVP
jgi:type IV secretion system protein VirB10